MADRRFTQAAACRVETRDDGGQRLVGYGAVFYRDSDPGTEYMLWNDTYERIDRGAFGKAMQRGDDVRGLYNHNPDYVLGRTASGTMRLSVDDVGLRYEIDLPDTQTAKDVAASVARGDITGSSFAFRVEDESQAYDKAAKRTIRTIKQVRLFDVGPVTYPAYEATTTALRCEDDASEARASIEAWQRQRTREAEAVATRARIVELDTLHDRT